MESTPSDPATVGQSKLTDANVVNVSKQMPIHNTPATRTMAQDNKRKAKDCAPMGVGAMRHSSSSTDATQETSDRHGWGWFDDIHAPEGASMKINQITDDDIQEESSAMAVTAPTYVLEESRSSQMLWKKTAGNRPPQPVEERAFYEKTWAANFAKSQVKYDMPLEILTASSPIALSPFADATFDDVDGSGTDCTNYNLAAPFNANVAGRIGAPATKKGDETSDAAWVKAAEADAAEATLIHGVMRSAGAHGKQNYHNLESVGPHHHYHTLVNKKVKGTGSGGDLTVLVRGDNVFGTTVSKSFARTVERGYRIGNDTVSISVASYRVVESKKHGKYAQFLVIYCEGSFRDTVGVWKRYSDFSELSRKVTQGHHRCSSFHPLSISNDDNDTEFLPNAITSWKLLKKRQRWYRCLDAGYLSLKVFLLERFLHDILFESASPQILRDFVGARDFVGSDTHNQ